MDSQNGTQEPSTEQGFNDVMQTAVDTQNFEFLIDTAEKSHRMLIGFREAIRSARYEGKYAVDVAMGLNFIDQMINQASAQVMNLKRAKKFADEATEKTDV